MTRATLSLVFTVCSLIISASNAETMEVRASLVTFMSQLNAGTNSLISGWNMTSDPCIWEGVVCNGNSSVDKIVLGLVNLTGPLDATSLCVAKSIQVLYLDSNNIIGPLPEDISKCSNLVYLSIRNNFFTGVLPTSLSQLTKLLVLRISGNSFVGELPRGMSSAFPNLEAFNAEDNMLSGSIPEFNFDNLTRFNVSNNFLSGEIPQGGSRFGASSFSGNPGLCGQPLPNSCTSAPSPAPSQG